MNPIHISAMLNFGYEKSSEEIKAKAKEKIVSLREKIADREDRIAKVRKEYGLDDKKWAEMLVQVSNSRRAAQTYSLSNHVRHDEGGEEEIMVGAGAINNLLTESQYIESEKEQVKKLEMIVRNLENLVDRQLGFNSSGGFKTAGHKLTHDELEYLGF